MKKIFCLFFLGNIFIFGVFAQSQNSQNSDNLAEESSVEANETQSEVVASKGGYAQVPASKRPLPIDEEKAKKAAEKDESADSAENFRKTIKYGIPSEISSLLDDLIENEDPRFSEEIYDVFWETKNATIKEKIINYFTKLKDPCLEDFAVDLLNDPYDEKNSLVKAVFSYVQECKTKAAIPAVINLIEGENENYFNDAITTLGEIGGEGEALFLAEYLDRDDLSDAQRQSIMRACGKLHAISTWDKMVEILEDEDENTFVRMYAAESLGLMKVEKSVPVLIENYNATDPNLRQYIIKGLANFPDVVEAKSAILQGIRDEHWKVRQEAIKTAKSINLQEAIPFLIYRVDNDSEKTIKNESISTIAALNTKEGNDFLVKKVTDKKVGNDIKKKSIQELLKCGYAGENEIIQLAKDCVNDDKQKDLRYEIGKRFANNYKSSYDEVCTMYLQSKDTTTVSLGLDMYKNGKPKIAEPYVQLIANDKKANSSNKNRAKKLLGIEDDEDAKSQTQKSSNNTENKTTTTTTEKSQDSISTYDAK